MIPLEANCASCILETAIKIIKLAPVDQRKKINTVQHVLKIMANNFTKDFIAVDIANQAFRSVYESLDLKDPLTELKMDSNNTALAIIPQIKVMIERIDNSYLRFRTAVIASLLGNGMDIGTKGHDFNLDSIPKIISSIENAQVVIDDIKTIYDQLQNKPNVVLIADNAGEIAFDTLLVEELKRLECHVTVVVKGGPISNDATMIDANRVGMDRIADSLITTEEPLLGINMRKLITQPPFKNAQLFIAKGQSNFETIIVQEDLITQPIVFLLMAKCPYIANYLGVSTGELVAKLTS